MRNFILIMALFAAVLHAEVINEPVSADVLERRVPIVDIRTPREWQQTGLLQGSIPIMFFDERGNYDVPKFLGALKGAVDTTKPFALICRTGSRTGMVSGFLAKEYGYKVINLQGGVTYAKRLNLPFDPYKAK